MASLSEFKALLTSSASIQEWVLDAFGDRTLTQNYGVFPCHIDQHVRLVQAPKADEKTWATLFFFASDAPFTQDNRFQITYGSRVYQVLEVSEVLDPRTGSRHHWEIACE